MTDPAAADVAREISGRTNIPVVVYPDSSHHVEPSNADVESKLRELVPHLACGALTRLKPVSRGAV